MRPLYKSLSTAPLSLDVGNAGLWYDKLCDRWNEDWMLSNDSRQTAGRAARGDRGRSKDATSTSEDRDRKPPKLAWIETIANGKAIGDPRLLAESATRIHRLIEARRGTIGIFTSESRFVTGLGRSHPVENGFAWHPTLGVPYLPGSSVKGMIRAWASRDTAAGRAVIDKLLGNAGAPRTAGGVVVLDAIPLGPVRLEVDVMTPHYAGWTPENPPGDWRDPVPVPFLVVAPQTPFLFSILPRASTEPDDLAVVFGWLRDALRDAGAGAKTAVGYGRFAYDEPLTVSRSKRREQERAALVEASRRTALEATPEGLWILKLEKLAEREVLDLVRVHLDKQPMADLEQRRTFACAVARMSDIELWRRGKKRDASTPHGPDKLKSHARLVDAAVSR